VGKKIARYITITSFKKENFITEKFYGGQGTELYNNWRTCSYSSLSQQCEAKNMADFQAK
jgi:hypothetical protein